VALAGAAVDGVGIPACIAGGERAADALSTFLAGP
jgi:oxygen-dependent protoporphyrinogen oxidase